MMANNHNPLLRIAIAALRAGAGGVRMSQWSAIGLPQRKQFWAPQSR
jgi:hypothetical protein